MFFRPPPSSSSFQQLKSGLDPDRICSKEEERGVLSCDSGMLVRLSRDRGKQGTRGVGEANPSFSSSTPSSSSSSSSPSPFVMASPVGWRGLADRWTAPGF
ncbi:hypothetical protein L249_2950 [Ophiocordyceps polyrhachis-furcata BCC 54312]|uniref:Uncharacterized protein n=1 Tax=Ophiocordyceps polyrhachis-furcata BCC 54312 TaxID=1330021 RepID=A0A367LQ69_9HYPO|nr:hypothetical protein L249_2950 [Ophiocordyceps polyrhachis-furcata BCC 54312]